MRRPVPLGLALCITLAACSSPAPDNANQSVDINAAADAARNDIATYAAGDMPANDGTAANSVALDTSDAQANTVAASTPRSPIPGDPVLPPAPGTPGGLPDDRTPVSEAPFTVDSAQGAANVVQTYYALIEEGKYRRAWALWDQGGKASGMSADAFAASFGKYSAYHANVGAPGRIDAGAGQRYVTVPVQLYGTLKKGGPFHMLGTVTLHRAGDIDGATAAQKSWHISGTDIKPRP